MELVSGHGSLSCVLKIKKRMVTATNTALRRLCDGVYIQLFTLIAETFI